MTAAPQAPPAREISSLDRAFARYLSRVVGGEARDGTAALVYHSALLVSAERAQGHGCVELGAYAMQGAPDDASYTFPPVGAWCRQLRQSACCAGAEPHVATGATGRAEVTPLVLDGTRLYLRRFYEAERRLADTITRRVQQRQRDDLASSAALFRQLFPEAATHIDWQAVAAVAALRSSLVFVTGGPGTGKTTVAARLLALLVARDPSVTVAVAAPTGRAAARLSEAIGVAVRRERLHEVVGAQLPTSGNTLHRLLGYTPWNGHFRHHAGNPLPHEVVIVDEASMVDVLMMDALFAACTPTARIIVLGDPDQLASVDTGFVLGDVARAATPSPDTPLASYSAALADDYAALSGGAASLVPTHPAVPPLRDAVVRLRVSYRFGSRPGIGALATATQTGDADGVLRVLDDASFDDVALDPPGSVAELLAPLVPHISAYQRATSPQAALDALSRFRILCALRDGETGVAGINSAVERWWSQQGYAVEGWYDYRPVLITANDPSLRLFNGDVGSTLAVDGVPYVHFPLADGGSRAIAPSRLPAHETAWAMTVHKSQGSEFDHVRLVLPDVDTRILTRELLYTGITRARERVTMVGTAAIIRLATSRTVARASGLVDRLRYPPTSS
jgi:exodeoxyribonuclease V alpha subunit